MKQILILFFASLFSTIIFGQSWTQKGSAILGESSYDLFGYSVSISGDGNTLVASATHNDGAGTDAGNVRVFVWTGSMWVQKGSNINGEFALDESGFSIDVNHNGSIIAIGARWNDGAGYYAGHVRVFEWDGFSWIQKGVDIDGEGIGDDCGSSVSLDSLGLTVAVGAPRNDGVSTDAGQVRVYSWGGASWVQKGSDIDGGTFDERFGSSVSLSADGNSFVAGAPYFDGLSSNIGCTRVYAWTGSYWVQKGSNIIGSAVNDYRGYAVSMNAEGNIIAIGAPDNDGNGLSSGQVSIYHWSGFSWTQMGTDIYGVYTGDQAGWALDLSGDGYDVVIGSPVNDDAGLNSGHSRIFSWDGTSWSQIGFSIIGEDWENLSGHSVSIDYNGDFVLIGAPENDDIATNAGNIRVFERPSCLYTYATDSIASCSSLVWIDGNTYNASNYVATHVLTNVAGCDSVVTLAFTLLSDSLTQNVSACDTYTWIDGVTYTASNSTATHTLTNISGCDSVISLNLTINYSSSSTDAITACDTYTWIDGVTYTASNNTATHTLTNASGCDSLVTLDLTINYSSSSTDVITACDTYTWIDGVTYTASNNTATHTVTNASGCDSLVTLDLTINYSSSSTDVITACDTYTWIDGVTYTASNNTATHTLTNASGCDSLVTLDLTINYSSSGMDVITACGAYTWIDGVTYTASNNTATFTLTTATGCDSVVTLNLIIPVFDLTLNFADSILSTTESGADSYQWMNCVSASIIVGETNDSLFVISNGEYALIIEKNGCVDTTTCFIIDDLGVNTVNQIALSVFPNPSSGQITIIVGQNCQLVVQSMDGKLVHTDKLFIGENNIDLEFLENGTYLIHLALSNGGFETHRIIIN